MTAPPITFTLKDGRVVAGVYLGCQDGFLYLGNDEGVDIFKQVDIRKYGVDE